MIRLVSWWNEWFSRFLSWRVRHIKERNFLIVLSMLVGIMTGLAGVLLKNSVHFTHLFFTEHLQIDSGSLLFFVSTVSDFRSMAVARWMSARAGTAVALRAYRAKKEERP